MGFYTIPGAAAHGTVISSATGAVIAFQINSSNVRIADLSINLTGAASTGINTAANLTRLVLHNIDVIVTCNGLAQGFTVWSSNIVMRNLSFYITSNNTAAYGFWFWNDSTSTINAVADCYNVTGTVVGAGTAAYCFACENINDANTLTLNLESCAVWALNGTPLDIAVASISTTTSTSTVNCYLCTLDGANYDAYQNNANVLNLGGSVLVNNLVNDIILKAMAPDVTQRYQRAADVLDDLLAADRTVQQRPTDRPAATPAPGDIERLMRGELVSPPRMRNSRIPQQVNDIILKAMAPESTERYQRAADLLEDLLAADRTAPRRTTERPVAVAPGETPPAQASWPKPRESPQPRFCWKCNEPLHARTDRCPFCGEAQ